MDPANQLPEVYKNPSQNIPLQKSPFSYVKSKFSLYFYAFLVLVIIVEIFFGASYLLTDDRVVESKQSAILPISEGQIILTSPKKSYQAGETIPVTIKISTGGNMTDSTDLLLKYDPELLDSSGATFMSLGKIYQSYPVADFDRTQGLVKISGTTLPNQKGFMGVGTLATLNFYAKKAGQTKVEIDFKPYSTADSNIVLSGTSKDILATVINADIMINESGSGSDMNEAQTACDGYFQYCQNEEGLTGKQFCERGKTIENQCTFDPHLTTLCSVCTIN